MNSWEEGRVFSCEVENGCWPDERTRRLNKSDKFMGWIKLCATKHIFSYIVYIYIASPLLYQRIMRPTACPTNNFISPSVWSILNVQNSRIWLNSCECNLFEDHDDGSIYINMGGGGWEDTFGKVTQSRFHFNLTKSHRKLKRKSFHEFNGWKFLFIRSIHLRA